MSETRPADPSARLRLFVALALPAATRESLAAWAGDALGGDESLRLVDPAALHVTLVFLGWSKEMDLGRVAGAVREASSGRRAPELRPCGLAPLPRRQPRVLAVDLEDRHGRAAALQGAVSDALVGLGLHERERRSFRPHVTVARVRRGGRPPTGRLPDSPAASAIAAEVVLYRSDPGAAGARYTALAQVPLHGDGP